jgi:hypothetical protein
MSIRWISDGARPVISAAAVRSVVDRLSIRGLLRAASLGGVTDSPWQAQHRLDRSVLVSHGEWIAARVPEAEVRFLSNEGHLSILANRMGEVPPGLASTGHAPRCSPPCQPRSQQ